ncbi:MAG: hypothetical protein ACK46Y_08470 [Fluviicola sp.]
MAAANKIEEKLDKHLNSPLSLLGQFKKWVLGEEKPDSFTFWSVTLNTIISVIFLLWSIMSLFVIKSRDLMFEQKKINVSEIIEKRGLELGFQTDEFANALENFHLLAFICWFVVIVGIVLQYRRNMNFIYFIGAGLFVYLIGMWIILGFSYWKSDTTGFDKSMFFLIILSTGFLYYYLKQELNGGFKGMFNSNSEQD